MFSPSLNDLLKQTSRSFYLTLRVLPRAIRPQISLAYLLARTTDTIADTEILPAPQRLEALQQWRERILGTRNTPLNLANLARHQGLPAERILLERGEEALTGLQSLAPADLALVRQVLDTITSGQELDLRRFGGQRERPTGGGPELVALQTDAELDDYTYRVAGCVGEFWTAICVDHLFQAPPLAPLRTPEFRALGVRFGKGLQLVNILRDLSSDLQKGRCYLPAQRLAEIGLQPIDLRAPVPAATFGPLYHRYLDQAEAHLAAGWTYTNQIPFARMNLRLACAWPILIGLETLQRLRTAPVLDPAHRSKVSRADVRRILFRSLWRYPFRNAWRALATFSR